MIDREEYIAHIQDQEQILNMRKIIDKIEIVLMNHTIESTDFLNPYERKLGRSILNRFSDINYLEIGGLDDSERQAILIYPDYHYLMEEDYEISAIELGPHRENFSHRDILGSLMGLGIVREKIGDIYVHDSFTHVLLKKELLTYVLYNLEKVGREYVDIKEIPLSDLERKEAEFKEKSATISSMRLDSIISMVWNLSRADSQKLISSNKVKINFEPINKVSSDIELGDLISVKGFGRFIVHSFNGLSRKDRIRITTRILK